MLHALTIALGAFLLFLIQPVVGRQLLPWLGGSASVWTACLATFQLCLLAGYFYADRLATWCSSGRQRGIHLALLAASLAFLPALPIELASRPAADSFPTLVIFEWIVVSTGLPLILLSASSPLLSTWYRETPGAKTVFRLYALSNAGSLLAVFGYPFLIEPFLTLEQQKLAWSVGYAVYVAAAAFLALGIAANTEQAPRATSAGETRPATWLLWFALSMCGTAMLTATTNLVCQEISVVPFLWLAPLGIYLVTLIIAFDHPRWYRRFLWMGILVLIVVPQCAALYLGPRMPFILQLGAGLATLLACCAVCHGELSLARPDASRLTTYYLAIAAGGCAGGLFVAVVAPLLFRGYWEYHLSLWASCLLAAVAAYHNGAWNHALQPGLRLVIGIALVALAVVLAGEAYVMESQSELTRRSFYGVLRLVTSMDEKVGPYRKLFNGRISHGMQYLDEDKRGWATLYYGRKTAVGLSFDGLRLASPTLRVGIVGLGPGTISAYGMPGDVFRYYELNPDVEWFARTQFTYLRRSRARTETVLGDARVSMERELENGGSEQYDLLIVDAFRSDAIPIHLLTRECAETYFRHLKDNGVLLIHISNRFVDLEPIVRGLAAVNDRGVVRVNAGDEPERGVINCTWMAVSNHDELLARMAQADQSHAESGDSSMPPTLLWTDDFSALWQVVRLGLW